MQTITIGNETVKQETLVPLDEQDNPVTLYGGTVTIYDDGSADVVSDVKTITITGYDSFSWSIYNTNKFSMLLSRSVDNVSSGGLQTSNYFAFDGATSNPNDMCFGITNAGSYTYIRFRYDILENSVDNWKKWLKSKSDADNPLQITIKLLTPETYHFTNLEELKVWLGENNFWCDISDDISVKYWNRGFGN